MRHDQTLRLGRVVEDLADLSAAESVALSLHPTDIDLAQSSPPTTPWSS
jgi:hypothetical protein